jgi:hypothetical protein
MLGTVYVADNIETHMLHRLGPFGMSKRASHNKKADRQALSPHTCLNDLEILQVRGTGEIASDYDTF